MEEPVDAFMEGSSMLRPTPASRGGVSRPAPATAVMWYESMRA